MQWCFPIAEYLVNTRSVTPAFSLLDETKKIRES